MSPSHTGKDPSTIVLPDDTIHGTRKHHFEMHDLSDISGGKWKAVHIPDEDISSMLKVANRKKGGKNDLDIEYEEPRKDVTQVPVEVHGLVHHALPNISKHSSSSVGKLIVAMENEERGKETPLLHTVVSTEIKLHEYAKNDEPDSQEIDARKGSSQPSVIVTKIPDGDDDSDSELPLQKPRDPVVASFRTSSAKITKGTMRSKILTKVMPLSSAPSISDPKASLGSQSVPGVSTQASTKNISADLNQTSQEPRYNTTSNILDKIKSLLLKSHSTSEDAPVEVKTAGKFEGKPLKIRPEKNTATHQNVNGLFLPEPISQQDAFANHADVLNKISSAKREALLVGIIKALLLRNKIKTNRNSVNTNLLPHYNKQAVLQGIQNLQMQKTLASAAQNSNAPARLDTDNPTSTQNLDELYQKQHEEEIRQELARANEETLEAKKMNQQEGTVLSNYNRFMNPESETNWKNVHPERSMTADGQVISVMGPHQLNMLEDSPSAT